MSDLGDELIKKSRGSIFDLMQQAAKTKSEVEFNKVVLNPKKDDGKIVPKINYVDDEPKGK